MHSPVSPNLAPKTQPSKSAADLRHELNELQHERDAIARGDWDKLPDVPADERKALFARIFAAKPNYSPTPEQLYRCSVEAYEHDTEARISELRARLRPRRVTVVQTAPRRARSRSRRARRTVTRTATAHGADPPQEPPGPSALELRLRAAIKRYRREHPVPGRDGAR